MGLGRSKEPDFVQRQKAAAEARKAALEKFRAIADPAHAQRQQPSGDAAADRPAAGAKAPPPAPAAERPRAGKAKEKTPREARPAASKARSKKKP